MDNKSKDEKAPTTKVKIGQKYLADVLPSGTYRVRKMMDAKSYSVSFDKRPTVVQVDQALAAAYEKEQDRIRRKTGVYVYFFEAAEDYTNSRRNVLSAATLREYDKMCKRLPEWFTQLEISTIDNKTMQKLVNEMSKTLSAKTVKDRYCFCVSAIRMFLPSVDFRVTLPVIQRLEPYIPSHEDVRAILQESVGTQYHIPLQLACYGMRREEVCALEVADLDEEDFLTINKALVQDTNKKWVVKSTKTKESTRVIAIDHDLAEEIRAIGSGRVFTGYPQTIAVFLKRTQLKLNIPRFSLHKLRHYFCTTLSENNVPEADILAMGGWKTDNVMKTVYRHSNISKQKDRMKTAASVLKNARS